MARIIYLQYGPQTNIQKCVKHVYYLIAILKHLFRNKTAEIAATNTRNHHSNRKSAQKNYVCSITRHLTATY